MTEAAHKQGAIRPILIRHLQNYSCGRYSGRNRGFPRSHSAEIFHQHDVDGRRIDLGKEDPFTVGRYRKAWIPGGWQTVQFSDSGHLAGSKIEKLDGRARTGFMDVVNPLLRHSPISPVFRRRLGKNSDFITAPAWHPPNTRLVIFGVVQEPAAGRFERREPAMWRNLRRLPSARGDFPNLRSTATIR